MGYTFGGVAVATKDVMIYNANGESMTIQNFVNLLLRNNGVVQFRTPDSHTVDYTFRKQINKVSGKPEEIVVKTEWEGLMHNISAEKDMKIDAAVDEIVKRVEKIKR